MELVRIHSNHFETRENVAECLPAAIAPQVRDRILNMSEANAGTLTI